MHNIALIPWLDPETIIAAAGPWALLVVCFIVFAETGLLVGFLLPGDTLLVISGLLSHSTPAAPNGVFGVSVWIVSLLIAVSAFIGGEVGYLIGHKGGPAVFERKESGVFSVKTVGAHMQNLLSKLGLHSRVEAVALAVRSGTAISSADAMSRSAAPSFFAG